MSANVQHIWETMTPLERLAYLEKLTGQKPSQEMQEAAHDAQELRETITRR
jgi:hypothetical protein